MDYKLVASNDVRLVRLEFAQDEDTECLIGKLQSNFASTWFVSYFQQQLIYLFPVSEMPEKVFFTHHKTLDLEEGIFFDNNNKLPIQQFTPSQYAEKIEQLTKMLNQQGLNLKYYPKETSQIKTQ
jgi:hypothetical protein